ncbi:MAG: exodeoxyribonuclease VII small subunit, partial [Actinomycetes bacterium]
EALAAVCQQWLDGARAKLDAALAADEQRVEG